MNKSDACLRELLAAGPRNSREVLAAMLRQGFSPKQVRRARERRGVLIERAGSGRAMHSIWRLPDLSTGAIPVPVFTRDVQRIASVDGSASALANGERRRHSARVDAFIIGGLDALSASQLADKLVERDRDGLPAFGSCAECQNLTLRQCPVKPLPPIEVHECWYRRQSTP